MRFARLTLAMIVAAVAVAPAQQRHGLSAAVRAYVKVEAPVIALTHVRVIDGTGAAAREDQTLIMRGGNIAAMGDAASVLCPRARRPSTSLARA